MISILEFFSGIGDAITAVLDFVIGLFRDFIHFLKLLAALPDMLAATLTWIPSQYLSAFLVLFGIVILYKILGREG